LETLPQPILWQVLIQLSIKILVKEKTTMIEAKYGVKYSFPHSLVHIVDHSGDVTVINTDTAEDPSLYSTIVVSGFPIGEDRRIMNITRSDTLNVSYGIRSLSAANIRTYGQSVEYPVSLIQQGAPVQLLRVTPEDATYAFSTILVEWRINSTNNVFEVRFKTVKQNPSFPEYDYEGKINDLNLYKNPDRLNNALVNGFKTNEADGDWKRRVFINNISAGRGRTYNSFATYINKTRQPRRANQVRYQFGTIDTRNGEELETFVASLINDRKFYSSDMIDTVNMVIKKREAGTSVIMNYVNEEAISEIYTEYREFIDTINKNSDEWVANAELYNTIFERLTVNSFDIIFGTYVYSSTDDIEIKLPYYQVDMYDIDIPKLDVAHRVVSCKTSEAPGAAIIPSEYLDTTGKIYDWAASAYIADKVIAKQLCGVSNVSGYIGPYVGDIYFNPDRKTFNIVTSINQYSGSVSTSAAITKVYNIDDQGVRKDTSSAIKAVYSNVAGFNVVGYNKNDYIKNINKKIIVTGNSKTDLAVGDIIAVTGESIQNTDTEWKLYRVKEIDTATGSVTHGKIKTLIDYPMDKIYSFLDYTSAYGGESAIDTKIIRMSKVTGEGSTATCNSDAWNRYGSLRLDDTAGKAGNLAVLNHFQSKDSTALGGRSWISIYTGKRTNCKTGVAPSSTNIVSELTDVNYDLFVYNINPTQRDTSRYPTVWDVVPNEIRRVVVTGAVGSVYRTSTNLVVIPENYYCNDYGEALYSEAGGVKMDFGSTGFFDAYEDGRINSIEFKWCYSELLVKAFRGEIDPRILSPTRIPAKYMFDGGWNTVVGLTRLPFNYPEIEDVIYASTLFTDDEKDEVQNNNSTIANIKKYADIDVKQAMYDLMINRCYQGLPDNMRPIGPGSGMSLHLDSGVTDASTALLLEKSFNARFDNPNASWDIGGYVSSVDGVSYTYVKRIVDNLIRHSKVYTVNKPYVGKYTTISRQEYISYFPDIDTTDWQERENLYTSGGNAWIADSNGNITRRSQRTFKQDNMMSDLIQENNMRTLSQLVYLLQNKIDTFLLEYDDDGVLQTMSEECNNLFSGWVGTRVNALSIRFERDTNPDGGEIVVCYVDVTFRGLILRVPIIVNVNRRNSNT
jgi:hypothetical protein